MPLQVKPNLPLFVAKRATLSGDGLPDITTISINVMKKQEENPTLSTGVVNPHTEYNPQNDRQIHFVELPEIHYDKATVTIPPPVYNDPAQAAANQTQTAQEPEIICNAVLDLAILPNEWIAKQGQQIPSITIRTETGVRTFTQATYLFDKGTGNFFIQARGFL